jgi:hypothetical protein
MPRAPVRAAGELGRGDADARRDRDLFNVLGAEISISLLDRHDHVGIITRIRSERECCQVR